MHNIKKLEQSTEHQRNLITALKAALQKHNITLPKIYEKANSQQKVTKWNSPEFNLTKDMNNGPTFQGIFPIAVLQNNHSSAAPSHRLNSSYLAGNDLSYTDKLIFSDKGKRLGNNTVCSRRKEEKDNNSRHYENELIKTQKPFSKEHVSRNNALKFSSEHFATTLCKSRLKKEKIQLKNQEENAKNMRKMLAAGDIFSEIIVKHIINKK